jgi:hypothetical protein
VVGAAGEVGRDGVATLGEAVAHLEGEAVQRVAIPEE